MFLKSTPFGLLSAALLSAQATLAQTSPPPNARPCAGFQWEVCHISPTSKPIPAVGRVVFSSNYDTGFDSVLQAFPGIPFKLIKTDPGPFFWNRSFINQVGTVANHPCSTANAIYPAEIAGAYIPSGSYKAIFSKIFNPDSACVDTVDLVVPTYPCVSVIDSHWVIPPSSPTAQDGFIRFRSKEGRIAIWPGESRRNNQPLAPAYGVSTTCSFNNFFCPSPPPNFDPPPFDPSCNPGEFPSLGQICRVDNGVYRIIVRDAYQTSCRDSIVVNVGAPVVVAAPTASQPSGPYSGNQTISLSTSTPGAAIYYTLNGNVPNLSTPNSFTILYTNPIVLAQSTTIRAISLLGGTQSGISVFQYSISNGQVTAAPTLSLPGAVYSGIQQLSLSCATPGATIYFTTNGNVPRLDVPNSFTRIYTGPIPIVRSLTLRALAVSPGALNSPAITANYTITGVETLAPPSFSPAPGNYPTGQSVTISSLSPGAQIYYTTNGMTPRPGLFAARLYATPVNIPATVQLKARAFRDGAIESAVAVGNYSIGAFRQAFDESAAAYYFEEEEARPQSRLEAYPNPSQNGVFELSGLEGEEPEVFNAMGQKIHIRLEIHDSGTAHLDLGSVPSGVYLLKTGSKTGNGVLRLVK